MILEAVPEDDSDDVTGLLEVIDITDYMDVEDVVDRPQREESLIAGNATILLPNPSLERSVYEIFRREDTELPIDPDKFYADSYRDVIYKLLKEIVAKEAPISVSELIVRVSRLHGFARAGATIRRLVEGIIGRGFNVVKEDEKGFVWPKDIRPEDWRIARDYKDEASKRDVDEITIEELVAFASEYMHEPSQIDAIRNALGYARLSTPKKKRIERALKIAIGNQLNIS